jgi:hypothetical protein
LKRVIGSIGKVRRSRRFIPVVSAGPQHQPGIKLALKVGESKVLTVLLEGDCHWVVM